MVVISYKLVVQS